MHLTYLTFAQSFQHVHPYFISHFINDAIGFVDLNCTLTLQEAIIRNRSQYCTSDILYVMS